MTNAELSKRLREHCATLRVKPVPLADLIPLLQQAADALDGSVRTASRDELYCKFRELGYSTHSQTSELLDVVFGVTDDEA